MTQGRPWQDVANQIFGGRESAPQPDPVLSKIELPVYIPPTSPAQMNDLPDTSSFGERGFGYTLATIFIVGCIVMLAIMALSSVVAGMAPR